MTKELCLRSQIAFMSLELLALWMVKDFFLVCQLLQTQTQNFLSLTQDGLLLSMLPRPINVFPSELKGNYFLYSLTHLPCPTRRFLAVFSVSWFPHSRQVAPCSDVHLDSVSLHVTSPLRELTGIRYGWSPACPPSNSTPPATDSYQNRKPSDHPLPDSSSDCSTTYTFRHKMFSKH